MAKQYAKPRLIRWIPLLQEFDLTIKDKKGVKNVMADHLSHLTLNDHLSHISISNNFVDEQLFTLSTCSWYADIANYLAMGQVLSQWTPHEIRKFWVKVKKFLFDDPYLFKY